MPHRMKNAVTQPWLPSLFSVFSRFNFDFGRCVNPSRERPYFFQGRLMAGAMIPFALLHVYGLQRLKWQRRLVANRQRGSTRAALSLGLPCLVTQLCSRVLPLLYSPGHRPV